ncbi:MAG: glycosyltransferase [Hyphomonadaceae bacterium]|nr:glycosyltransferase [Hyphomonadaceae bacterium]
MNEDKWFESSLQALHEQNLGSMTMEVVLVDSGSTDRTLEIAAKYNCRITHIKKSDFSFGRSLNQGCDFARGNYLVFISAHCIPANQDWLLNLIRPLIEHKASYSYGRQLGHDVSQFSEKQIFAKYFPGESHIPQEGFFINNANSAIIADVWKEYRFDESVTGLEDMVLGKQLVNSGHKIAYVADAPIIHVHEESYEQTIIRYYREALTLRDILPDIHMNFADFVRYYLASVWLDFRAAGKEKTRINKWGIVRFRFAQFWGNYKGHNEVKKLSRKQKEDYYYPKPKVEKGVNYVAPPKISPRASAE